MSQDNDKQKDDGEEYMKLYHKTSTKLTECFGDLLRRGLEEDEGGLETLESTLKQVIGNDNFELGKDVKAAFKQHKAAEQDGKEEFLEKYLESLGGSIDEDDDPYGNGDQTRLKGYEAQKLRTQWSMGFDYNPATNERLSDWCRACFYGDKQTVKKYIDGISSEQDKMKLLERRESMLRFCGILHVIGGARINASNYHIEIAKLLIESGCRLDVKDVAGYTPVHHCLTMYGNDTTLEIAKILVENGACVNATNRFGCTPLMEPCMNYRYEFIEFLVTKGANPAIKDNDGVSCQDIARGNAKIASLFSKGYREMARAERAHKAKDGAGDKEEAVCAYCLGSGKLSKCSGCLSVRYCSRACQSHDWKAHKPVCKENQAAKKTEGEMVYVKPVLNPHGKEFVMYNQKTKKVDKTGKGKMQKPASERAMKVKIQVSIGFGGVKDGPMLVYNKDRSCKCYIVESDANYRAVHNKVVEKGYGGVKAYFAATLKKSGDLHINLSTTLAETF